MGKAEEIERRAIRIRMSRSVWSVGTKVNEARLVGMKRQPIPLKTTGQDSQDPFGIFAVLECHHKVISVPDQGTFSLQAWAYLGLEPFIPPYSSPHENVTCTLRITS